MKSFVTGATGFIGLHLVRKLVDQGHQVAVLVRTPEKAKHLPRSVEILSGNLSSFKEPEFKIPECDVVIHLAGVIIPDDSEDYFKYNFESVKDIIDCIGRQSWTPKRFVFASSLAAAGPSGIDTPLTEDDIAAPIDLYGKAELQAELYLQTLEIPTTSFRPSIVIGPGDWNTLTLFETGRRGIGMRVAGQYQQLSVLDVDDLNEAIIKMALDTSGEHKVYFVSAQEQTDLATIWKGIGLALNKKVVVIPIPKFVLICVMHIGTALNKLFGIHNKLDRKQYEQMTQPSFMCSSEKLQRELGWSPEHDVFSMTKRAADGYKEIGWL